MPIKGINFYSTNSHSSDLGAHIDGFIAVAAHTIVVGAKPENKAKGRAADVVLAAYHASQAALRLLKDGTSNYAVTEAVQKIAAEYKCKPIEGMLSHQLKQFKIDGEKTIIQNPTIAQKKEHEKCEFEKYEVYAMDVLVSTGEGLGKELDTKVSIYKKTEENYLLKLKASRAFYVEVGRTFGPDGTVVCCASWRCCRPGFESRSYPCCVKILFRSAR